MLVYSFCISFCCVTLIHLLHCLLQMISHFKLGCIYEKFNGPCLSLYNVCVIFIMHPSLILICTNFISASYFYNIIKGKTIDSISASKFSSHSLFIYRKVWSLSFSNLVVSAKIRMIKLLVRTMISLLEKSICYKIPNLFFRKMKKSTCSDISFIFQL